MKRIRYIVFPSLIYCFFAFVIFEPSPANWGSELRYLFAMLVSGALGLTYVEIET